MSKLKEPIQKFQIGDRVVCRVPGHPECDFNGKISKFHGCWGSGNTWYDVTCKKRTERFYGGYVSKQR